MPKLKTVPKKSFFTDVFPLEERLALFTPSRKLSIGMPKEHLLDEKRIALTPHSVDLLVKSGHKVVVEKSAGVPAHYSDLDYSNAGATIAETQQEVFQSEILLKVAPFLAEDLALLRRNQIVISAFQLAYQSRKLLLQLIKKRITAIGFEYLMDENNKHPIVQSMSEITGNASISIASEYLSNSSGGQGILLGGIAGVPPTEIVILGAGTTGEYAARAALGLGAQVKLFDSSLHKLRKLQQNLGRQVFTSVFEPKVLEKSILKADAVIAALDFTHRSQGVFILEETVKKMKTGSVIIDVSIDQGACFETSRHTTHKKPVYTRHGVVHYCVPNIPSRVARTASVVLSTILTGVLNELSFAGGVQQYIKQNKGFRAGVYLYNGILTNYFVGEKLNLEAKDIELLLAAF